MNAASYHCLSSHLAFYSGFSNLMRSCTYLLNVNKMETLPSALNSQYTAHRKSPCDFQSYRLRLNNRPDIEADPNGPSMGISSSDTMLNIESTSKFQNIAGLSENSEIEATNLTKTETMPQNNRGLRRITRFED